MKKISIVSPTYNEEKCINELYSRIVETIKSHKNYIFEIIIIDNASTDKTIDLLREIAKKDRRVKIIVNIRNFGHMRSPYWALLQAQGDGVIFLASDLQDPPELIDEFIRSWENGYKVVMGIKTLSEVGYISHFMRKVYYRLLNKISDIPLINDATGFGMYDKKVMDIIKRIDDPNPYFRGLICEIGYPIKKVEYTQSERLGGNSKNNLYTLIDIALLGITSHSLVPIRLASLVGIFLGSLSLIFGVGFLFAKLIWWENIPFGVAPLAIIVFFLIGLILIFIGILGEYVASMIPYLKKRPIIIESERINFD